MGKSIGIKLADGTFYPIVSTDSPGTKDLGLTTVQENQSEVRIDLYRGDYQDGAPDSGVVEYLDTLRLDQLIPRPSGDVDIDLTVTIDADDLLVADLFDPESGERTVKSIPRVTSRSAVAVQFDMFGFIERGQDVLDSLEGMDDEISEEGGDDATEEIGLPFDEVTASDESLFVDEESEAAAQNAPEEIFLKDLQHIDKTADFDFGDGSSPKETKAPPPASDALMKRVRFIGIAVVVIMIEVLVVCFFTIRPRLAFYPGSRAQGNYGAATTTAPSPRS